MAGKPLTRQQKLKLAMDHMQHAVDELMDLSNYEVYPLFQLCVKRVLFMALEAQGEAKMLLDTQVKTEGEQ